MSIPPSPAVPAGAQVVPPSPLAAAGVTLGLIVGYIGIYLCRKNFSVAVPLLQDALHATRAELGWIASASTFAYAVGKLVLGPLVDRVGGRTGFLLSLVGVAVLGGLGAFAPGLALLGVCYSANRFAGSAGWSAMMKLVPGWFRPARTASVVAVLSLSYVLGGSAATLFAGEVVKRGGSWRAVLGVPSLVLGAITLLCFLVVRRGPLIAPARERAAATGRAWEAVLALLGRPQFLVVCALSFTLTLMREAFNNWSVDFLRSVQRGGQAVATAATQSIGFDLAGAASILAMGFLYDKAPPALRRWLIAAVLALLSAVLLVLPGVAGADPSRGAWLVSAVGLLVYGPYSLLGGVMAVESGGPELAATASGVIDAVGYLAGVLAGALLGHLLDVGGYALGFRCLAGVTVVAALVSLALRPQGKRPD